MASCVKCGQAGLARDKMRRRRCKRCGVQPSGQFMDRGGNPMQHDHLKEYRASQFEPDTSILDAMRARVRVKAKPA